MISYDTSSVEAYVTENNAKCINSCIRRLKSYFKAMGIEISDDDIYKQAYKVLYVVPMNGTNFTEFVMLLNNLLIILKQIWE